MPRLRGWLDELRSEAENAGERRRELLVDVSVIAHHDAHTGVQRVVRSLAAELAARPLPGYTTRFIQATGRRQYTYATAFERRFGIHAPVGTLVAAAGDVFFGLDLSTHGILRNTKQLNRWRADGCRFLFLVHDLLPVRRPEWFRQESAQVFGRWLRQIALYAEGVLCVSRTVSDDVRDWVKTHLGPHSSSVRVSWFHLAGNIEASVPTKGSVADEEVLFRAIRARPFVLTVGTIEPRKGHDDLLSAFEELWKRGIDVHLVVVGKKGWSVDDLLARMSGHPEGGRRFFWLAEASDETLLRLYSDTVGVIAPSRGEGFGLPLLEAAHFDKPILARDIPVFREIGSDLLTYFPDTDSVALADVAQAWLEQAIQGRAPTAGHMRRDWNRSASDARQAMLELLGERAPG